MKHHDLIGELFHQKVFIPKKIRNLRNHQNKQEDVHPDTSKNNSGKKIIKEN